jgi:hypothetical protein
VQGRVQLAQAARAGHGARAVPARHLGVDGLHRHIGASHLKVAPIQIGDLADDARVTGRSSMGGAEGVGPQASVLPRTALDAACAAAATLRYR